MNLLFTSTLALHVLVAVLGLGSILSIAVVAVVARRTGRDPADVLPWIAPLLRLSAFGLGTMLVTGILLDLAARGAFRESWWFRGSALLLIGAGAMHGAARRTVRQGAMNQANPGSVLRRVERLAYAMCAVVAGITVLMEVKPF